MRARNVHVHIGPRHDHASATCLRNPHRGTIQPIMHTQLPDACLASEHTSESGRLQAHNRLLEDWFWGMQCGTRVLYGRMLSAPWRLASRSVHLHFSDLRPCSIRPVLSCEVAQLQVTEHRPHALDRGAEAIHPMEIALGLQMAAACAALPGLWDCGLSAHRRSCAWGVQAQRRPAISPLEATAYISTQSQ